MQANVELPKALSVRDENEFYAHQHLMARLNPKLRVSQVGTGIHRRNGCTVFWGLVHLEGQKITSAELQGALEEAGFDSKHNGPIPPPILAALNRAPA